MLQGAKIYALTSQVCASRWKVKDRSDAQFSKCILVANARQLKNLGTVECASR
jgi:hypothetical protein